MRHLRLVPDMTNIDFMRYTRVWLVISVLGVLGSIGLVLTRGLNLGVDFRGGTIIQAATPEPHPIGDFRAVLTDLDFGDVGVTEISDEQGRNVVLMRLGTSDDDGTQAEVVESIRAELTSAFPGIEFLQVDSVGGKVSGELVRSGFLALGPVVPRHHDLRLAAVRVAVRRRLGAVADPRRDRDGGPVQPAAARVQPDHRRGGADGDRLLDQRHGGGVRPDAREPAQVQEDAADAR